VRAGRLGTWSATWSSGYRRSSPGRDWTWPRATSVDDDPAAAWGELAAALQAALDDPAVAGQEFDAGPPGRLTVEAAVGMLVTADVLIHTWDLARAGGRSVTLDPPTVAELEAGMEPLDEMLRASGHYGPRVPIAADAPAQDRLLAFMGRVP